MSGRLQKKYNQRVIIIFTGVFLLACIITGISIHYVQRYFKGIKAPTEQQKGRSVLDKTGIDNVDIMISTRGFLPNSVNLTTGKSYDLRFIKEGGVTCTSLRNEDINITIDLPRTAVQFPLTITSPGTYIFYCDNQDTNLEIKVK